MSKMSTMKGRRGEEELARILKAHGYNVQRGTVNSYGEVPDLRGLRAIHIECKRSERLCIPEWTRQSERDALKFGDGSPCVFFRQNGQPWYVVQKLVDWLSLYEKVYPAEKAE